MIGGYALCLGQKVGEEGVERIGAYVEGREYVVMGKGVIWREV